MTGDLMEVSMSHFVDVRSKSPVVHWLALWFRNP